MFDNTIFNKILYLLFCEKNKYNILFQKDILSFFIFDTKKRLETENYIIWTIDSKNKEEYIIEYCKKINIYSSKCNNNNKLLNLNVMNYCNNIYINEKCEYEILTENYIYILNFLFGITFEDCKKINNIANNFFDKFILHCEKIEKNIYSFPTEVKEFNLDKVFFEFDEEKNIVIDEYTIKWYVSVIIEENNKIIKSERFLGYDYIDEFYFCDTQYKKPMSDISYLYKKWCNKYSTHLGFSDEFSIYLDYNNIEKKVFRLKTVNPYFAFMTFVNAKYEELCKLNIS